MIIDWFPAFLDFVCFDGCFRHSDGVDTLAEYV